MKKRLLSILLALYMVLAVQPGIVWAKDDQNNRKFLTNEFCGNPIMTITHNLSSAGTSESTGNKDTELPTKDRSEYSLNGAETTEAIFLEDSFELTPAVKYIYYSAELPSTWQVNLASLPNWLNVDKNVLYGMPTESGETLVTLSDGSDVKDVRLIVRENGDNSVRASISEGYVVVQDLPDIADDGFIWVVDDIRAPEPDEPDIFDRLLDVYLDGRKLTGGKLAEGEQAPDDWEYYARPGGVAITICSAGGGNGQGTLSVTFMRKKATVPQRTRSTRFLQTFSLTDTTRRRNNIPSATARKRDIATPSAHWRNLGLWEVLKTDHFARSQV